MLKGEKTLDVICDRCGCSTKSEAHAAAARWLIDYKAKPHTHLCPTCHASPIDIATQEGG